jgi:hypothetical protein
MKLSKTILLDKWFFIFPLLIAIYPIIFLYSNNVQELLLSQIYVPIAVALIVTLILWASLSFLLKDVLKAGIITTIFIVFFFTYGTIFDWLESLDLFTVKHRHILPILLFIAVYLGYFVYLIKSREFIINTAKILTVIVTVLLVMSIITIIPYDIKKMDYANRNAVSEKNPLVGYQSPVNQPSEYPDIYYIILDEYASSSTIKEIWGYDNSEFENHLIRQGFYVADNSSIRYHHTPWSLATSLNMEYPGEKISHYDFYNLTITGRQTDYSNISIIDLNQKINNNKVTGYLKNKGYTLIALDAWTSVNLAKGEMIADQSFIYHPTEKFYSIDNFGILLVHSTLLRPLEISDFFLSNTYMSDEEDYHRNTNLFILSKLKNIYTVPGPKFVFVHITLPHTPFVFDETGAGINKANSLNWQNKKYYLSQYIFTTNQITPIIDNIQQYSQKSGRPAVIILQSDHGPRPFNLLTRVQIPSEESLDIPVDDMFKIFNAYYFPDTNQSIFYNNISPVNSFRLLFNTYFKENYPLLEDE